MAKEAVAAGGYKAEREMLQNITGTLNYVPLNLYS